MTSTTLATTHAPDAELADPPFAVALVTELMSHLTRAIRAHQLYLHNNPTYLRAIENARGAFRAVWHHAEEVAFEVTETQLKWEGRAVLNEPDKAADNLPWLLYKDGVRELRWKILSEHGHTVLEARHGRDALTVAAAYEGPIHLLLTDVVMPEMGAGELAEQLLAARPDLKVLYVSGYTNDEIVRRGVKQNEAFFIQKPFSAEELMGKVREVLDLPHPSLQTP